MLIGNEPAPRAIEAMDAVGAIERPYRDRRVHYSHEMSEDTAEASARTLIRTVPLIYGVLLGGILGHTLIGVSLGLALAVAFDTRMGKDSLSLPVLGPIFSPLCPLIDGVAHGLARGISAVGLPAPSFLATLRCQVPRC